MLNRYASCRPPEPAAASFISLEASASVPSSVKQRAAAERTASAAILAEKEDSAARGERACACVFLL